MKTSIATVTVTGDLGGKLAAIAGAGFDGVEILDQDFIAHDGGPREIGRMVRDNGLERVWTDEFVATGAGGDGGAGLTRIDHFDQIMSYEDMLSWTIFDTGRRLADRGFEPLPIPETYYDDLEARFDLPPVLLDRLREADVLYDRVAGSDLFQMYSRALPGGLRAGIVQRGPGYRRFGEANAPFRTAAQKRLARPKGMPGR